MTDENKRAIGKRLENIRIGLGLKKYEMAAALEIKEQNQGNIEHGKSSLSLTRLFLLHEKFGVSADEILFGDQTLKEIKQIKEIIAGELIHYSEEEYDIASKIIKRILAKIDGLQK